MSNARFHGLNTNNSFIIATDFVMFSVSFLTTFFCGKQFVSIFHSTSADIEVYLQFFVYSLPLHLLLLAVGIYNEKLRETYSGIVFRIFVVTLIGYLVNIVLSGLFSKNFFPLYLNELLFISTFISLSISRFIILKFGLNQLSKRKILILGSGKRASIIEQCMQRKSDRIGLEFLGFIYVEGDAPNELKKEQVIRISQPLEIVIEKLNIDELVIATDERRNNLPIESLLRLKQRGVQITDIIDFVERETGQVAVDYLTPSWFLFQNNQTKNLLRKNLYWIFNTFIALIIAFITLPIILLTIVAIKIEGGIRFPILYSQQRVGLNGRHFSIYKFTSMQVDAEKDGVQWAQTNDPRTTVVGKFIRKFRIDELPQLFNVIIGDMYFVGPRPERPQFTEGFNASIPYYDLRHNVKPGLTGWAQLKYPYGSSERDALEKLKFDLYYIRNRNFTFDLLIILKTSEIILFGKGR